MPAVLLDTDVTSFLFKKDTRGRWYKQHLHGQDRVISFMTLAELDQWAIAKKWGQKRRDDLERFLGGYHVFYADRPLCGLWAEVVGRAEARGQPIQVADAWIAATAIALGLPLLTHNAIDFAGVDGLTVITAPPSAPGPGAGGQPAGGP
jgi:tRNA(fMet)-specific endonuclease VapC